MTRRRGRISVVAGTNGAGKSAIAGQAIATFGGAYFNPDLLARRFVAAGLSQDAANARAWRAGFEALRRAITNNEDFSFETTLGGESMTRELHRAIEAGLQVIVWYAGLDSPERHIRRVRARVARGGHDIPAARIRERYPKSLANLAGFLGKAAEVHVFDNSVESADGSPVARLVFRMHGARIVAPGIEELMMHTPGWARPIVAAALRASRRTPAAARPRRRRARRHSTD